MLGGAAEALDEMGAGGGQGFLDGSGCLKIPMHRFPHACDEFVPMVRAGRDDFAAVLGGHRLDGDLQAVDECGLDLLAGVIAGEEAEK